MDIVRAPGKTNFANGESPPKILKSNDLLAKFVENNESLINGIFCDMELTEGRLAYRKEYSPHEGNYRLRSIVSLLSKIFQGMVSSPSRTFFEYNVFFNLMYDNFATLKTTQ